MRCLPRERREKAKVRHNVMRMGKLEKVREQLLIHYIGHLFCHEWMLESRQGQGSDPSGDKGVLLFLPSKNFKLARAS